ncbi:MAG: YggS family pyridoxal phosphate-dependent enzyme [Stenotrophobium sp.]
MTRISDNLLAVRSDIARACKSTGRNPESLRLLAVSKYFGVADIREAIAAGQRDFGENYVQEALDKIMQLPRESIRWHFIGPIQSNKTRDIAEHFDWVQSIDRLKIAQRLSQQRPAQLPALNICIQVNISGEGSKSGCRPEQALELCRAIAPLPHLCLRGLMAIPAPEDAAAGNQAAFRALHELAGTIRRADLRGNVAFDTLSMGMSDDYASAIAEGSTMVRIGTAIFGARKTAAIP